MLYIRAKRHVAFLQKLFPEWPKLRLISATVFLCTVRPVLTFAAVGPALCVVHNLRDHLLSGKGRSGNMKRNSWSDPGPTLFASQFKLG